jgi:hypothetical protein
MNIYCLRESGETGGKVGVDILDYSRLSNMSFAIVYDLDVQLQNSACIKLINIKI